MNRNARQLVGSLSILVFLLAYIVGAATLADLLPNIKAVKAVYFIVAGIGWGLPIIPLLTWMDRGRWR